ncbi:DUF4167 domain-containing protein [Asticcacaulis sp. YBE204]|uniref:DUF4167 domain-containing protein n=1 Tax=Asticcacaulis sp. YBE204 TaxID=1282363 RepID=UPI0003C3C308|nr:DUF4167 domain-containing protein [Asticcacaulis sp. YBE204]ESQ79597.1 hypothetical protein AEYBE204_07075 [Asticcacaulis sp. YBE204]
MKRQRSRNRKPTGNQQNNNPNRAYESNGPDTTKVRGNAQTIYEKYQQLARDANSSGDRVLAENYLQHAEHYFRLIRQMQPNRPVAEFLQRDPFSTGFDFDEELDGEPAQDQSDSDNDQDTDGGDDQPRYDRNGDRSNRDRNDRNNGERNNNRDRNDRNNNDRYERNNRDRDDRNNRDRNNGERNNEPRNDQRNEPRPEREPREFVARDNAPRDVAEGEGGGRRESRRERYERRRLQRLNEQEFVVAGTEPLGAPSPSETSDVNVAGFDVVTPEATPIAPVAEATVEAAPKPARAPRARPVPVAEADDHSHLPAFLRAPVPVSAPVEAELASEEAAPKKPRARRKKPEDALAQEVSADEA